MTKKMRTLKPLYDRIILKKDPDIDQTDSGLFIPPSAHQPSEGTVIAVGSGARDNKGIMQMVDIKEGDKVLFPRGGGAEVYIDGQTVVVMNSSDIIAVVD